MHELCSLHQNTVEPVNKGHFGTAPFVLSKEVVLFGRRKMYKKYGKLMIWRPQAVSFVERFVILWPYLESPLSEVPLSTVCGYTNSIFVLVKW